MYHTGKYTILPIKIILWFKDVSSKFRDYSSGKKGQRKKNRLFILLVSVNQVLLIYVS